MRHSLCLCCLFVSQFKPNAPISVERSHNCDHNIMQSIFSSAARLPVRCRRRREIVGAAPVSQKFIGLSRRQDVCAMGFVRGGVLPG
jgi:hypothetical protein